MAEENADEVELYDLQAERPQRIRVKEKDTGHHVTIAATRFLEDAHVLLKTPAVDKAGRDVPPKYHVTKGGAPAKPENEEAPK